MGKDIPGNFAAFQAAALVIFAAAGAFIAWNQMKIARLKLKFDLYSKRNDLYNNVRQFLFSVYDKGNVTDDAIQKFLIGTSDVSFLFGKDIEECLDEVYHHALDLKCDKIVIEEMPIGKERTEIAFKINENTLWLVRQGREMANRFHPYMKLSAEL